jgi:hypothetical protein
MNNKESLTLLHMPKTTSYVVKVPTPRVVPFVLLQLGHNEQWQNGNDDEADDEDFLPGRAMFSSIIFVALVYNQTVDSC